MLHRRRARAPHMCSAQSRGTPRACVKFCAPPCASAALSLCGFGSPVLPFDVMRVLDTPSPSICSTCGQCGTVGVEPQYRHDCARERYHGSERGIRFDGLACCSALGANLLEMNPQLEQIESPPVSGMKLKRRRSTFSVIYLSGDSTDHSPCNMTQE